MTFGVTIHLAGIWHGRSPDGSGPGADGLGDVGAACLFGQQRAGFTFGSNCSATRFGHGNRPYLFAGIHIDLGGAIIPSGHVDALDVIFQSFY